MKKILLLMVSVGSIFAILGSCATDDDSAASTTSTAFSPTTTASGSITVGSETMSGTYASDCNDLTGSSAIGQLSLIHI